MSLVDQILAARGYSTKAARAAFLSPDYELEKHDPFLLPDMDRAVERIVVAKERGEKVVVYGDYDIDGLTASTVLLESLEKFGLDVSVFIPNRFVEGYGLSRSALETLADNGAQLVITVDCGSLSHTEIAQANLFGLEVIVTDHHSVAETMPPAVAVINPKRLLQEFPEAYEGFEVKDREIMRSEERKIKNKESGAQKLYPFLDLAGVGVAFKLVQALQTRLDGLPKGQEKWLLDLVAFGTVCDVVQLRGENRVNVHWGLKVMQKTRRVGLRMLMAVAKIEPRTIDARTLGFVFGPRLNASGRMETAQIALDLLTATDTKQALALAMQLERMNTERRAEQKRIFEGAKVQAVEFERQAVLVVSDPSWSHGIIGIVAAKLLETHHKPTFVLQELEDGTAKGSARSFGDFSAVEAIRATQHLLLKGGGHALAAGITLETEKIGAWRAAVNAYYLALKLEDQERHFAPRADVTVATFAGLDEALLRELSVLEPYGNANPEPIFCAERVAVVVKRTMGDHGQHVVYTVQDAQGVSLQLVGWNMAEKYTVEPGEMIDVWFELTLNEWRGRRSVQGKLLRLAAIES